MPVLGGIEASKIISGGVVLWGPETLTCSVCRNETGFEHAVTADHSTHCRCHAKHKRGGAAAPYVCSEGVFDFLEQNCIAAGMSELLSKPFSKEQLQDLLRVWIGKSSILSV